MPRVLVADDSEALRLVVRITVQSQGWTVLEAASGEDAILQASTAQPDLILLDLHLGEHAIDGVEVCQRLRAIAATAETPIIMLTASDRSDDRADALAAGVTHFMAKPFGPLELLETMRRVLYEYYSGRGFARYLGDAGATDLVSEAEREVALSRLRRELNIPIGGVG